MVRLTTLFVETRKDRHGDTHRQALSGHTDRALLEYLVKSRLLVLFFVFLMPKCVVKQEKLFS